VVSRRGFLAGGAVALLAGCGEEDVVVVRPADAMRRQLAAEQALAAATAQLPRSAPRSAADTVRKVSERAEERARKLAVALSAEGGPPEYTIEAVERVDAAEAVARAQAAIVAHVVALPDLAGRELRLLGGDLVAGAAADTALLSDALGLPVDDPFPGTPR
jgi:hypothetical protein